MKAYHYDRDSGIFKGVTVCQVSPLEKGKYLVPAFSVLEVPPQTPEGYTPRWTGSAWEIVSTPAPKGPKMPDKMPPSGDIPLPGLTPKQKFEIQAEVKKHVKEWENEAQSIYSPLRQMMREQKEAQAQTQPAQVTNPEPAKE